MFYKIIITQIDYIITLSEDSYIMQEKKILYKKIADPLSTISHLDICTLTYIWSIGLLYQYNVN